MSERSPGRGFCHTVALVYGNAQIVEKMQNVRVDGGCTSNRKLEIRETNLLLRLLPNYVPKDW